MVEETTEYATRHIRKTIATSGVWRIARLGVMMPASNMKATPRMIESAIGTMVEVEKFKEVA